MLKDASVLITGGAKGIGRYVAGNFAREGARIALADIDSDRLQATVEEIRQLGVEVIGVQTDVRDEGQMEALVDRVVSEFGRLDVMINNAGIVPHFNWNVAPRWPGIKDIEKDHWSRVIDTNLLGTYLGTKHALRRMVPQGSGHVLNLHGGGAGTGSVTYVVSKEAIAVFGRYVAEEVRDAGVFVGTISPPGAIATEDAPEEARARMLGTDSLGDVFVRAAEADLSLSGKLLSLVDGKLIGEDWIGWGQA